jgi:hypothetical protein
LQNIPFLAPTVLDELHGISEWWVAFWRLFHVTTGELMKRRVAIERTLVEEEEEERFPG